MPTSHQLEASCVANVDVAPEVSAHREQESGFTLVELVIAFVLFAIASAIVMTVVMQGLSGASNSRAGGISDAAIRRTVEAIQDDVALAATQDTRAGNVRDELQLAQAIRTGSAAYRPYRNASGVVNASRPQVVADIDDVRVATPTRLQLMVGEQCITWSAATVVRDGIRSFDITRQAAPAGNCNAPTETRRYVSADLRASGVDTTPFSYRLMCHPSACSASQAALQSPCRPWVQTTSVPRNQRRWIVGVDVSLAAVTTSGGGSGAAAEQVSASIRARATDQHQEALGC